MPLKRKQFMTGLAVGAGVMVLPGRVFGANDRINIAFVGAGGKGWHAVKSLAENPMVNYVAFADVDQVRSAPSREAHPDVPFYTDFRVMLDKHPEIDGVIVSTPDHTHHYIARYCMKAGKHVYLEKPLAHNIAQVRDLMALEKETGLACQMGNQGHSGGGILMLEEWIKAGVLGDIREVHAWAVPNWSFPDTQRPAPEPVPDTLDWDKWLGPAAAVPYSSKYLPGKWRGWFDFGCGTLGDWFCHNADAPYTALGLDCPIGVEIESTGPRPLSFPESAQLTFTFPKSNQGGAVKLHWYQGPEFQPPRPEGLEEGRDMADNGGTILIGSKATVMTGTHAGVPRIVPEALHREVAPTLPRPNLRRSSHWDNWLLAIRGEETCRSVFAYGGRLTEIMHFGNIALHVNRNLKIDAKTRAVIGDKEAAQLMEHPAPRKDWKG